MESVALVTAAILIQQKDASEKGCFRRKVSGFHTPSRFSAAMNASCDPAASISGLFDSN